MILITDPQTKKIFQNEQIKVNRILLLLIEYLLYVKAETIYSLSDDTMSEINISSSSIFNKSSEYSLADINYNSNNNEQKRIDTMNKKRILQNKDMKNEGNVKADDMNTSKKESNIFEGNKCIITINYIIIISNTFAHQYYFTK